MTDKQKKNYLDKGGIQCPYCNSFDITGEHVDIDEHYAIQKEKKCLIYLKPMKNYRRL